MTSAEQDFRRVRFKSPETVDKPWLEWFREQYGRQFYKLDVEPCSDSAFKLEVTTRLLPDLAIARSVRSCMRASSRGDAADDISIFVPLAGRALVRCVGESFELTAGMGGMGRHDTGAIIDIQEEVRVLSVRMRRRMLEPLVRDFGSFSVVRDTHAMRLLLSYVRMIEAEDAIVIPEMQRLVTTHVHDLVALAFGATRDAAGLIEGRGARAGRLAAVKQDILAHLDDPALSVSTLAARQGLSPRYVHKLFELEGTTYSEFVVGRRLGQAHRMLTDPRFDAYSISAIALTVGFGDLSYFNRTFRRRFGATPSEIRITARIS